MTNYSKEEMAYREQLIAKIENAFSELDDEVSEIQTPKLKVVK